MEAKLQKWGNSDGIRIPSSFLRELNLKTNDMVELTCKDDKIIITKQKKKKVSLEELFKQYNEKKLSKEFIWDEEKGREIW